MSKIEVTKINTEYILEDEDGLKIKLCCHEIGGDTDRITIVPAHKGIMDRFWFEKSRPGLVEGIALLILEACKIAKEEGK